MPKPKLSKSDRKEALLDRRNILKADIEKLLNGNNLSFNGKELTLWSEYISPMRRVILSKIKEIDEELGT